MTELRRRGAARGRWWGCLLALMLLVTAAQARIEVVDARDRVVGLEAPAKRVLALAPHLAEAVFYLGAAEQLVGTVAHSDYPAEAARVPQVGDAFALSWERILDQRPDLILAWGATLTAERLQRLQRTGASVYVSEPSRLSGVLEELDSIAQLLGKPARSEALRQRLKHSGRQVSGRSRVLPLIAARPPMTLAAGHFVNDALRYCRAHNPLADALVEDAVVQLSHERLLTVDADLVLDLTAGDGLEHVRLPPEVALVQLDPDLLVRPGPRVIDGVERLCALLAKREHGVEKRAD